MWRLGLGPMMNLWPRRLGRIAVLGVTGRRSGRLRLAPVNYAPGEGDIFCVAGFGKATHWYLNLTANPDLDVWLPDGRWQARARTVSDPALRLTRLREVLQNSGFAAEAMAGIDPYSISDESLAAQTADYQVVQVSLLERVSPRVGDLGWVWLVALALLALVCL